MAYNSTEKQHLLYSTPRNNYIQRRVWDQQAKFSYCQAALVKRQVYQAQIQPVLP